MKVIVPFAAGGPTDVMARLLAQKLSEDLKQQFYVENHAGAGGNIGMVMVARSAADGYTILVASSSYIVNPSLYANNPLRPAQGFRADHAGRGVAEYPVGAPLGAGQDRQGIDRLAAGQSRQIFHRQCRHRHHAALAAELFKLSYKLDATSVPFSGAGPAIQSTIANQTPIAFSAMPPAAPQVTGGNLRGLAVTSANRVGGTAGRADHGGGRCWRRGIRDDAGRAGAGRNAIGRRRPSQ